MGRFNLVPAPAGLRLAQDLVNTTLRERAGDPGSDHLADSEAAQAWLGRALADWADATGSPVPEVELERSDLARLGELREGLRERIRASATSTSAGGATTDRSYSRSAGDGSGNLALSAEPGFLERAADVRLTIASDGRVSYRPLGVGASAVAGLIAVEILLAQTAGTWGRLKTCARPECGACFYDSSPNRSRAWHNTKTCGNLSNLRASRARKRSAKAPDLP
ncbi:CGNR zinc finger domain-containing protein [Streptomyces liangshanensis]|uniref:CGNR zinc finger domain-containing protein n=1 Tax=Streptomyces liangshanensis TaxID=2717324 RepID=A0A6G9GTH8_9ACTN|nr:CGNR zinc finger domain-containing protein [Streptomyces liangshanensis]QIQ01573.1 CGNR zinc finger domain-containing protein [Streptomyces liangshanensis]